MPVIAPPVLSNTPDFPQPADRAAGTYNTKAYAFGKHMADVFNGEMDAVAANVASNATDAATSASTAAAAAAAAAPAVPAAAAAVISASAAEASRIAASKLNLGNKATAPTVDNQGAALLAGATYYDTALGKWRVWTGSAWGDGISAVAGVSSVNGQTGAVTLKTVNGTALTGTGNIVTDSSIYRSARTSNTALAEADKGKLIDITSGTFTQTFAAVATLGDGWFCYIKNSGTGDVTLDPNSTDQIDGLTSFVMYPGEVRLVQCDGTALRTVVLNSFFKRFTGSGTFTKPPGYLLISGLAWGAGGSGAKNASNIIGGGGGACLPFSTPAEIMSATISITIGAGAVGPSATASGALGGDTTLTGVVTAYGGAGATATKSGAGGGSLSAAATGGDAGLPASGGSVDATFGGGNSVAASSDGLASVFGGGSGGWGAGRGGESIWGGGGGGGNTGVGGKSAYGGGGGKGGNGVSGFDGTAPGGAGGGTNTGTKAGDGARGELRIWGII